MLGERTAAEKPDRIIAAARDFLEGLNSRGVGESEIQPRGNFPCVGDGFRHVRKQP